MVILKNDCSCCGSEDCKGEDCKGEDCKDKAWESKRLEITVKEKRRKIILIISLVLLLAGAGYLIFYFVNEGKNDDIYDEVQQYKEEKQPEVVVEEEEEPVVIPIDFASLKQVNPDIYAWIDIADTNVHYPIVQSATDDTYYLEHTIEGVKGYPGSIYTEMVNAKDFSDFNTLIYVHDMKDGSMFKHLHKFADAEFFNTHDTIMIYTETAIKTYKVLAAVVYDDRHIMYTYDNDDVEARKAFIQSLYESKNFKNQYREGVEVDENSHLITLSTCITGQPSKRFIVVAVEVVDS